MSHCSPVQSIPDFSQPGSGDSEERESCFARNEGICGQNFLEQFEDQIALDQAAQEKVSFSREALEIISRHMPSLYGLIEFDSC